MAPIPGPPPSPTASSEHFGPRTRAFPVFNGTGANVAAIAATTRSHQAVICAAGAHLDVDECGAPEHIAGIKLLTVAPDHGKLTPALLDEGVDWTRVGDEHSSQPALLTISNATEVGTIYTAAETSALADFAHSRNLLLHIDGARLANAAARLDTSLAALTTDAGADIVSFGGTKNGLLMGEAVIFLREELAAGFDFVRKQTTQLASKMRFISVQLDTLLTDGLWLDNARQANAMADRLAGALTAVDGIELAHPVEANGVFPRMPGHLISELEFDADGNRAFHIWDPRDHVARFMCSWDTTPEDVDAFAARLDEGARHASSSAGLEVYDRPVAEKATAMTIDELARKTGMTVRNIRAHQSRGLLPPPEVRGRTGYYGDEHAARIELIRELQAEGLNLEAIRRLTEGAGDTSAEMLDFTRAIRQPFEEEEPEIIDARELAAPWGDGSDPNRKLLQKAERLGIVRSLGEDRYELLSPRLLRAGSQLADLGVPAEQALAVVEKLRRQSQGVAKTFIDLFVEVVWEPFDRAGRPDDQWPEVIAALERLRPLASESLLAVFQITMSEATESALGRTLQRRADGRKKGRR